MRSSPSIRNRQKINRIKTSYSPPIALMVSSFAMMDAAGRRRSQSTTSNLSSLVNSTHNTPLETHIAQFAGNLDPALSPSGQSVPHKTRPPSPQDFLHPASGPHAASHQQTDLHQSSLQADQASSVSYPADSSLTYNIHFNPPIFSLSSAIQYAAPMTAPTNSPFAVGAYNAGVAALSPRVQHTRPAALTSTESNNADTRQAPPTPLSFTHPYSAGYYISTGLTPIYTATQFRADPFFGAVSHLTPTPSCTTFEAAQPDFAGSFPPMQRPVPIRYHDQASDVMSKPKPVRVPVSPQSPVKSEDDANKVATTESAKVDSPQAPSTEERHTVEAPVAPTQEKQSMPHRLASADVQSYPAPEQRAEPPRPPVTASDGGSAPAAAPFEYAMPQAVSQHGKSVVIVPMSSLTYHSGASHRPERTPRSGAFLLFSGHGAILRSSGPDLFCSIRSRRSTALHSQSHAPSDPGYQRQPDICIPSSGIPTRASHVSPRMGSSTECIRLSLWRRCRVGSRHARAPTFRCVQKRQPQSRGTIPRANGRRRRRERRRTRRRSLPASCLIEAIAQLIGHFCVGGEPGRRCRLAADAQEC